MVISWFYFQDIENSSNSVKSCYTQRLNKYTMIREFFIVKPTKRRALPKEKSFRPRKILLSLGKEIYSHVVRINYHNVRIYFYTVRIYSLDVRIIFFRGFLVYASARKEFIIRATPFYLRI